TSGDEENEVRRSGRCRRALFGDMGLGRASGWSYPRSGCDWESRTAVDASRIAGLATGGRTGHARRLAGDRGSPQIRIWRSGRFGHNFENRQLRARRAHEELAESLHHGNIWRTRHGTDVRRGGSFAVDAHVWRRYRFAGYDRVNAHGGEDFQGRN